jgi:hypothetical protein
MFGWDGPLLYFGLDNLTHQLTGHREKGKLSKIKYRKKPQATKVRPLG